MKIRSKCFWYQYNKKSTKLFLWARKEKCNIWNYKTLINDGKQIITPDKINLNLKSFYQNLLKKSISDIESFLSQTQLSTISDESYAKCETDITAENLFIGLRSMPDNKSPGNDGLSKGFYEAFL